MTTGQLIKAARKKAGMTQSQLAEKLNIPYQSIGQWERDVRKPKLETLNRIAAALDIQTSQLLEPSSDVLSPDIRRVFLERLLGELALANSDDIRSASISCTTTPNGDEPISLNKAKEIAEELGVTLDYLVGHTDDPNCQCISLGAIDPKLEIDISDADDELINTVHEICGMDKYKIAEDHAIGAIEEVWNPAKIDLVREYIKDSHAILKKMINAMESPARADDK